MAQRQGWSGRGWLVGAAAAGLVGLAASFRLLAPEDYGQFVIEIVEPAGGGVRIQEDGLFANFHPAPGEGPHPGILLLGGSEGGLGAGAAQIALELQREGFSVLQLAYFGVPEAPETLERIPLEHFDRGLAWLAARPEIDDARIGLVGVSKGAEAALLVAAENDAVSAVVAAAPASVVWNGIDWSRGGQGRETSWTRGGEDLTPMPYGEWTPAEGLLGLYGAPLDPARSDEMALAAIPIERARAAVLLVCGRAETLWPSCPMADQLEARAGRLGGPEITVLAYDDAGHLSFGPPLAVDHPFYDRLGMWGGSPEGNAAARADGWPRTIAFLRSQLEADQAP